LLVALAAGGTYAVAAWQVLFRRNTAYEKAGIAIGAAGLALVLLAFARVRPTYVLAAFGMAMPVIAILVANWPRLAGRHVAQALTVLCVLALLFPGTCFMVFRDFHYHP
jgi:hypothetical protein